MKIEKTLALALKELGFDNSVTTPLYHQAFRWFRVNYGLVSYIKEQAKGRYSYNIERWEDYSFSSALVGSWDEAELDCLKKLIDICKFHPLFKR